MTQDNLKASEALYGFAGWLTGRKQPVIFSSRHNAAVAAELVNEFCKANNLSDPDEGWDTRLIHPSGEVAITGRGKNS